MKRVSETGLLAAAVILLLGFAPHPSVRSLGAGRDGNAETIRHLRAENGLLREQVIILKEALAKLTGVYAVDPAAPVRTKPSPEAKAGISTVKRADLNKVIRSLQTDNRLLAASLKAYRKELQAGKAENLRLRALLKEVGIKPDKKRDEPTTKPVATSKPVKVAKVTANDVLIKAVAEYVQARRLGGTRAQAEAAFSKLQRLAPQNPVTITYEVSDVAIEDDNTASLTPSTGTIKPSRGPLVLKTGRWSIRVRMSRADAVKVKKGDPLIVTGTLWLAGARRGRFSRQDYFDLGRLGLGAHDGRGAWNTIRGWFIQRKGLAVTLNGRRVTLDDGK